MNQRRENLPKDSLVDPDPHHFGNLEPHPDPHPHQIKIRIRIKVMSCIRKRIPIRRCQAKMYGILAYFSTFSRA